MRTNAYTSSAGSVKAAGPQLRFPVSSRYFGLQHHHSARWYALVVRKCSNSLTANCQRLTRIKWLAGLAAYRCNASVLCSVWGEGIRRAYWYSRDESTEQEEEIYI